MPFKHLVLAALVLKSALGRRSVWRHCPTGGEVDEEDFASGSTTMNESMDSLALPMLLILLNVVDVANAVVLARRKSKAGGM